MTTEEMKEQLEAAKEVIGYARAYRTLGEFAAPELDWALKNWDEVLFSQYALGDTPSGVVN